MRSSIPFCGDLSARRNTLDSSRARAVHYCRRSPQFRAIPPTPPVLGAPAFWALNGFAPGSASTWSYRLSGFHVTPQVVRFRGWAVYRERRGVTSRAPGVQQGLILSSISVNLGGTMYNVLLPVGGTFQIDSDCTSGTIQLASGTNPGTVRIGAVRFLSMAATAYTS